MGGFPERARALLGASINEPVLHVCGGMAKHYPYRRAFGPEDKTLDFDPACEPDFLQDAREPWPLARSYQRGTLMQAFVPEVACWKAVLIDPPYSPEDSAHYMPGVERYPRPNLLVARAFEVLAPGGRVGIIHYILPSPPKGAVFVAAVGVLCGFNNRMRCYSVFEKPI